MRAALASFLHRFSPPPPPLPPPPSLTEELLDRPAALAVIALTTLAIYCARRAPTKLSPSTAAGRARSGVLYGSMLCFMSVSAAAVTFPFAQTRRDALGCDALCQGGQTSLRSGLTLVGAALVGRASDRFGRIPMLWMGTAASLCSLAISATDDSLRGLWISIVPVALLNNNFSVCKALFSDYIDEASGTDAEKAGAVGRLGMAVGLSFMAGPLIGANLVSGYRDALLVSAVLTTASAFFIFALPKAARRAPAAAPGSASPLSALRAFISLPVLRTRGAQLLMAIRVLMALAFHMFAPAWQARPPCAPPAPTRATQGTPRPRRCRSSGGSTSALRTTQNSWG